MNKIETYRVTLRTLPLPKWDTYLLQESHLPGPRSNLELAQAVADEGDAALFERYIAMDAAQAPVNTPGEFLAVCGAIGLGRLLVEGHLELFATLRQLASDSRWRMREGVAMALQRLGDAGHHLGLHPVCAVRSLAAGALDGAPGHAEEGPALRHPQLRRRAATGGGVSRRVGVAYHRRHRVAAAGPDGKHHAGPPPPGLVYLPGAS